LLLGSGRHPGSRRLCGGYANVRRRHLGAVRGRGHTGAGGLRRWDRQRLRRGCGRRVPDTDDHHDDGATNHHDDGATDHHHNHAAAVFASVWLRAGLLRWHVCHRRMLHRSRLRPDSGRMQHRVHPRSMRASVVPRPGSLLRRYLRAVLWFRCEQLRQFREFWRGSHQLREL
jgi:hypothetical protein